MSKFSNRRKEIMLSFSLDKTFIESYRNKPETFGFNGLGNIVFYRTYSRIKDNGEYETWVDVCERVINGMYSILQDYTIQHNRRWDYTKAQRDAQEAFDRMFNFKWTPSGRGLWMMGTPFIHERKTSEALLNCAFISTKDIASEKGEIFEWIANMLMLGVGVAFDTIGAKTILVTMPDAEFTDTYVIPDSREGWAKSITLLINTYLTKDENPITFDYSLIRKKGEPIKGFGGIASGSEPLELCHNRIREYLNKNCGKDITSRTITDICNAIGACVVAGNVRRSAELALGYANDEDYISLKNYSMEENKYRMEIGWSSNNSVIGDNVTDYSSIANNIYYNGEPGLIWLDNISKYGRMGEKKYDNAIGVNPCFTSDTMVQTLDGHYPIAELVGKNVSVWNGREWTTINNFRKTGEMQPITKITLHDGTQIRATPYHKFILENGNRIEARDLSVGDRLKITSANNTHGNIKIDGAYIKGFLMGDGTLKRDVPCLYLYSEKYQCEERLISSLSEIEYKRYGTFEKYDIDFSKEYNINRENSTRKTMRGLSSRRETILPYLNKSRIPQEMFAATYESKLEFLAGLFDADGTAADTKNGFMYQISSINENMLYDLQLLLKSIGVQSTVRLNKKATRTDFNDGYGEYDTKELYRLTISQTSSIHFANQVKFSRLISLANKTVSYNIKPRWNAIDKIEYDGEEDVYCCTVEDTHQFSLTCGIDVGQCGEVALASREMCNLSEIYMQNMDDEYDFQRTIKFAYLYSKAITLTYEWISDKKSRKIMMKNRRTGVGTTGIAQFLATHSIPELTEWWNNGYNLIQSYDNRYSQWLNVPKSIRTTTMKPSGTVSLLAGATPGAHFPHDNWYIRRVRIQSDTPMLKVLEYAGYRIEKDAYSDNTSVVEIPIHIPGKTIKNMTIWEQMQLASLVQKYWSDNSVSVTISFEPEKTTIEDIKTCIALYANELKSVSMLPITPEGQYAQMPYESITKEEYNERIGEITKIANLAESMTIINKMKDLYCDGDSCSVV